jgi:hypothetical protein
MLHYFTPLFQRSLIMAFYSRNFVSLVRAIENYSRPFDEILYSYDLTTNDDNHCHDSTSQKDTLP